MKGLPMLYNEWFDINEENLIESYYEGGIYYEITLDEYLEYMYDKYFEEVVIPQMKSVVFL